MILLFSSFIEEKPALEIWIVSSENMLLKKRSRSSMNAFFRFFRFWSITWHLTSQRTTLFNFAEEIGTHRILLKDRVGNFRTCAFNALEKHSKGLSCKCTHFEFSHLDGDFHIFKRFPENEIERLSKAWICTHVFHSWRNSEWVSRYTFCVPLIRQSVLQMVNKRCKSYKWNFMP